MIDLDKIKKLVEDKYISVQKHPTLDLYIYNYTQRCQFERVWTEETLQCRGLILDGKGNVVAKPFRKFFNLEEFLSQHEDLLPIEDFEVFDKLDGSLGILYWEGDKPAIATRGSFVSDQAKWATNLLRTKYDGFTFPHGYTHLFEIIYPENRIVVDYGGTEDLFLLAVVNTETGEELSYNALGLAQTMSTKLYGFTYPVVERFDGIADVSEIKTKLARSNKEGFVIRYASGLRLKVKYAEYVRLHRLITGVNAKSIWEMLKMGQPLDELLEKVPDEFFKWVNDTATHLNNEHYSIKLNAESEFKRLLNNIEDINNRKEFAEKALQTKQPALMFKLYDKRDIDELIWKMVRPVAEKPFQEDIDA